MVNTAQAEPSKLCVPLIFGKAKDTLPSQNSI